MIRNMDCTHNYWCNHMKKAGFYSPYMLMYYSHIRRHKNEAVTPAFIKNHMRDYTYYQFVKYMELIRAKYKG